MSKNQKIILAAIIILLILGAYYRINKNKVEVASDSQNQATTTVSAATTTNTVSANTTKVAGYTVEQVPVTPTKKTVPMPDLNRPVTFASNLVFTDEVKAMVTAKIKGLQDQIRADKTKLLPWIDLGMYQKMAGDYEGARISWKYVSEAAPNDFLSRGNLGNLYAYYLKDNAMAETYYKDAISKDTKQIYLYIQLAEVYKDVFHDTDKSKLIIDQGLKVNPGNQALIEFKNSLN